MTENPGQTVRIRWPFIIAALLLVLLVAVSTVQITQWCGGRFFYPSDDTYIHLTIARNLAEEGCWSLSGRGFESASSSVLWTLILAAWFFCTGVSQWPPLILNLILSLLLLHLLDHLVKRAGGTPSFRMLMLLAPIFLTQWLITTMVSMEHILHAVLTIWFIHRACIYLDGEPPAPRELTWLCLSAALLSTARLEACFTIIPILLVFLFQKKFRPFLLLSVSVTLPLLIFGLFSYTACGVLLPFSALAKAGSASGGPPWKGVLTLLRFPLKTLIWLLLLGHLLWRLRTGSRRNQVSLLWYWVFLVNGYLYMHFMGMRAEYFRYICHLEIFQFLVCGMALQDWLSTPALTGKHRRAFTRMLLLLVALLAAGLGQTHVRYVASAAQNICDQQSQMAEFVRFCADAEAVAVNDIGYLSWSRVARIVDLCGLSNLQILRTRRSGQFNTDFIRSIARESGVRLAMVYDDWFEYYGGMPGEWIKLSTWTLKHPVVVGQTVTIYATRSEDREDYEARLRRFEAGMPERVLRIHAQSQGSHHQEQRPGPMRSSRTDAF